MHPAALTRADSLIGEPLADCSGLIVEGGVWAVVRAAAGVQCPRRSRRGHDLQPTPSWIRALRGPSAPPSPWSVPSAHHFRSRSLFPGRSLEGGMCCGDFGVSERRGGVCVNSRPRGGWRCPGPAWCVSSLAASRLPPAHLGACLPRHVRVPGSESPRRLPRSRTSSVSDKKRHARRIVS